MNEKYEKIVEQLGKERVKLDEPLAQYTSFKIGGPADLFVEIESEKELVRVLKAVRETGVPYFILGGGSNILMGDKGFRGIVIKVQSSKFKVQSYGLKFKVYAEAGMSSGKLLEECLKSSLTGLGFMAGIPGTIGGSIRGNAGAWQNGIGEKASRVKTLTESGEIRWISKEECQFSYRDSRFKHNKEIILAAELILEKGDTEQITGLIEENLEKRAKQPKEPSAGCIFINPKPLSAGELIEKCGLKGTKIGQAQISKKHANFIINLGGAKAVDVVRLIDLAKKRVKVRFNVDLEEEVVRVGEF